MCHSRSRIHCVRIKMMKFVIVSALVAFVAADVSHLVRPAFRQPAYHQPAFHQPAPVAAPVIKAVPVAAGHGAEIAIVSLKNDISPEGSYDWAYQTANGIAAQESAQIRALGPEQIAKAAQGSFQWTSPEGVPVAIQYVADENGYQPSGDAIPQPPPVPLAIQRSLEWIAAHPQPQEPLRRF